MQPTVFGQPHQERSDLRQCTILCGPFNMFDKSQHFGDCRCVVPRREDEWQWGLPTSPGSPSIGQQLVELDPALRQGTHPSVVFAVCQQSIQFAVHCDTSISVRISQTASLAVCQRMTQLLTHGAQENNLSSCPMDRKALAATNMSVIKVCHREESPVIPFDPVNRVKPRRGQLHRNDAKAISETLPHCSACNRQRLVRVNAHGWVPGKRHRAAENPHAPVAASTPPRPRHWPVP